MSIWDCASRCFNSSVFFIVSNTSFKFSLSQLKVSRTILNASPASLAAMILCSRSCLSSSAFLTFFLEAHCMYYLHPMLPSACCYEVAFEPCLDSASVVCLILCEGGRLRMVAPRPCFLWGSLLFLWAPPEIYMVADLRHSRALFVAQLLCRYRKVRMSQQCSH